MDPYQHQELEQWREVINHRNRQKKFGQVFGQVLGNTTDEQSKLNRYLLDGIDLFGGRGGN